jgi:2-keto-4-pentenoate hydratase
MRTLLARRDADLAGGASAVGWKIGFNSPGVQDHFGLSGPVVGYLTDATVVAEGEPVDLSGWTHPALEVEVAIRVGHEGEVAALAPALELVDLDLPFDSIEPILAGNVFHRAVVFGAELVGLELPELSVSVSAASGGEPVASGSLAEQPAVTVEVVRSFLGTYGAELAPGERIIAGSMIAPLAVASGDSLDVSFGVLGSISIDLL